MTRPKARSTRTKRGRQAVMQRPLKLSWYQLFSDPEAHGEYFYIWLVQLLQHLRALADSRRFMKSRRLIFVCVRARATLASSENLRQAKLLLNSLKSTAADTSRCLGNRLLMPCDLKKKNGLHDFDLRRVLFDDP